MLGVAHLKLFKPGFQKRYHIFGSGYPQFISKQEAPRKESNNLTLTVTLNLLSSTLVSSMSSLNLSKTMLTIELSASKVTLCCSPLHMEYFFLVFVQIKTAYIHARYGSSLHFDIQYSVNAEADNIAVLVGATNEIIIFFGKQ